MTLAQITERVEALERKVRNLKAGQRRKSPSNGWWRKDAGRFENDPLFEEIVRLGRKYRKGQNKKGR